MPQYADTTGSLLSGRKSAAMPLVLIGLDTLVIAAVFATTVYARYLVGGDFLLSEYWVQWPVVPLYILVIASFGGYDMLLSQPQELRATSLGTIFIIAVLSSVTFWMRFSFSHSRAVLLIGGSILLVLLPTAHYGAKRFFSRYAWWGFPTVFYVFEKKETHYIRLIMQRLHVCLRPVLLLRHREDSIDGETVEGIAVLDGTEYLSRPGQRLDGIFIFLGYPQLGSGARTVLRRAERRFTRTIILHESLNFGNQWAKPVDMGHHLGLEVVQRLLDGKRLAAKRLVDLALSVLLLVLLSPLLLLLATAIVSTSPGPVFFRHNRMGRGGKPFRAWKFRTMVSNASAVLQKLLDADPALREEWETNQKLAKDPRITPIGRLLRRTSLDELPQLFNVLAGDMSLIGPRPIVAAELKKYGERYEMVSRVRPGMTGLWQVSGRSSLPYEMRVELDTYYIKNWSFWLDLYIMLKTPWAILRFGDAQ
ncbi:MAG: undecaprenyl-phosphate galactose phosphotransferase WbaP [Humidesulfovibrio sp.]|nr:undecaprenyl-phosphate galactose phosphotransferase WbaP [Humidesulfovibrio sp.]